MKQSNINLPQKSRKLCFYHPHRHTISGALFYFYALANYCSQFSDYDVYIVNYKNAKYNQIYKENNDCKNITFLDYEDNNEKIFDDNTLFFTSFHLLPLLVESFKKVKKGNVFLINLHPRTTDFLLGNCVIKTKKDSDKLLNMIYANNSVAFMDKSCFLASQKIYPHCPEKYMPVFLDKTYEQYQNKHLVSEKEINIGCVSRLDVDKIETVINFLNNAFHLKTEKKINVHLIGDGTHAKKINFKHYAEKINIIYKSYMYGDELRDYISNNIDILFNFGLAALDVASMKLPVAVPIYNMNPHHIDCYYFLKDTKDYNLGCSEDIVNSLDIKTYKFSEIIDFIYNQNLKEKIGNECFDYCIKNHKIEITFNLFKQHIQSTTLTIGDCLNNKFVKKLVSDFAKFRAIGGKWEQYIVYRKLKLKDKIRYLLWNYLNNKLKKKHII